MAKFTVSFSGSDLSGSDGGSNRTYTLSHSNALSTDMQVFVSGVYLHQGQDYTFSSAVITFLNPIFNSQPITVTYFTSSNQGSSTDLAYSSVQELVKFLHILRTIPDKDSTSAKEEVGTGDNSNTVFWLDNIGVLGDSYTVYYGSTAATTTTLTETTHYSIDLDTSKITLTSAGVTLVGTSKIWAVYDYNSLGFLNSEMLAALNAAESKVNRDTGQRFADSTDSNPGYRKITNEIIKAHYNPYQKVYDFYYSPVVNIQTTLNGAYTTGATALILSDASLLPTTGTIYAGGNKIAYTAKETNTLTVPATTPSIDNGETVRGEVIEVSREPEGTSPSYEVLVPDTEYEVDYDQGFVKLLNNAYFGEVAAEDRIYPSNYLIRVSYMQAWHEPGADPTIPDEITWVTNAIAARKLMGSVVAKAHSMGLNDFNPRLVEVDQEEIDRVLEQYKPLNVGTSQFNKQRLT